MRTLRVELGERSYPIRIGSGLLSRADLLAPHLEQRRVAIVTNETVAPLYLAQVRSVAAARQPLEVVARIFDALLQARCDRRTMILALGGGVIGDMAGFAAACYQRGVPFIQI